MGVVVFTKVRGLAKSESLRTLRVLGPLQNLLLPLTFRSNVPVVCNFKAKYLILNQDTTKEGSRREHQVLKDLHANLQVALFRFFLDMMDVENYVHIKDWQIVYRKRIELAFCRSLHVCSN